ncbi:MAG: hypothetical protein GY723_18520 [bacterium]|nr:hypothetical protein [bacterium]MCP5071577.1 hypothetical protein [bacterium]
METAIPSRPEALATAFGRLGMPARAASTLSADLVLRHPMARRLGLHRMEATLREQGLAADPAADAAPMLFALESYDLGHRLADVRNELRIAGVTDDRAVAAVFEAARLHRESGEPEASVPHTPGLASLIAASLTLYTVAVALWLLVEG